MIENTVEYEQAKGALRGMEGWLARRLAVHPIGSKGFTKAGICKMIARPHKEMSVFEGGEEAKQPELK